MTSTRYNGMEFTWEGELDESTEVTVVTASGASQVVPFSQVIAMTNGDILAALEASGFGMVRSDPEAEQEETVVENPVVAALEAKGVVASAAVVAREGLSNSLQRPDRAAARLLGDDGLGRAFDALVASGVMDKSDLLATAVERSHEYWGVPTLLASGAAREWASHLPVDRANDMLYNEAAAEFESDQAQAVVASARANLRKRVLGG